MRFSCDSKLSRRTETVKNVLIAFQNPLGLMVSLSARLTVSLRKTNRLAAKKKSKNTVTILRFWSCLNDVDFQSVRNAIVFERYR